MTADTQIKAPRSAWIGLAVLALPCMVYSMDMTVLNLAMPQLARDLQPSAGQLLWIIDIYGFMVAGFLMVMGSLGDRVGRRRILLCGAAAFALASLLAAFAQTAGQLVLARAVLGIAGATLAPSTLSLITSMFRDEGQRTFAISMWIMSFSVGAIIGPVVGGVLIETFWWGAVFLIAVPVMGLLLILGPILLPEFRDPAAGRIDYLSAVLSLTAVLTLVWGLKIWAEYGLSAAPLAALVAGAGLIALFIRRQRRLADPLIDLALFRLPRFSLSLAVNTVSIFFMFGSFIFVAQYLQLVAGLSPLQAGLWSLPGAVAFTVMSPFIAPLAARLSPAGLMAGGLGVCVLGFLMLALIDGVPGVVASNVVMSLGFAPVIALTTGFIVGSAPVERAGIASAMSETGAELGGALGVALLGSLLTAFYRSRMTGADLTGLPADVAQSAQATLAGAVEAAALSGDAALLGLARDAFTDALKLTALLGAVALAALAILVRRVLTGATPAAHGG